MATATEPNSETPPSSIDVASGEGLRRSILGRNPALGIIAICAVILLLRYMQEVLIPFVLAGVLFYALDPLVDRLQRWHIPRVLGAAFAIFLVVGAGGALTYSISDDVIEVVSELPAATQKLRATLRANRNRPPGPIEKLQQAATELDKTAAEVAGATDAPAGVVRVQVEEPTIRLGDYIRWGPAGMASLAGGIVMVLFLAYFLLVTDDLLKRRLVEIMGPTLTHQKVTVQVLNEIAVQIEKFLLVQIFTSVLVGTVTWLALSWVGLSNAAVWGLVAGVLNSVPYFGPLIVTGALTLIAYVQFGTVPMALTVAGIALLITTVEGWVLTPLLMSRVGQINAVAIFAGLLFWSWLWGLVGMLLAVPMMMALKVTCDHVEGLKPVGKLLGE